MQLSQIQEQAQKPIHERRDRQLTAVSLSSQTSDSVISQNGSAGDTPERSETEREQANRVVMSAALFPVVNYINTVTEFIGCFN